jgi:N-acetylglucosaminyldiphosphoundecaprenol N-acetyl-beta-D-mannosaminyltransferase
MKLFGLNILDTNYKEVLESIPDLLKKNNFQHIVTLNSEILINLQKNQELNEYIKKKALVLPDGIGITWASKIINKKSLSRITGVKLTELLLAQEKYSFFIIGSDIETNNLAISKIKSLYPKNNILGFSHGYINAEDEEKIVLEIKEKKPDIILVGMGFPKQEYLLEKLSSRISYGIGIGVGGTLDVLSGNIQRAPDFAKKYGLEWLYRGLREPKRILRWGFIPIFAWLVINNLILYNTKNEKR